MELTGESSKENKYFPLLDNLLEDHGEEVTYNQLCKHLSISADESRRLLENYYDSRKETILAKYLICGSLAENRVCFRISTKVQKEELMKAFKNISIVHLYSITKKANIPNNQIQWLKESKEAVRSLIQASSDNRIWTPEYSMIQPLTTSIRPTEEVPLFSSPPGDVNEPLLKVNPASKFSNPGRLEISSIPYSNTTSSSATTKPANMTLLPADVVSNSLATISSKNESNLNQTLPLEDMPKNKLERNSVPLNTRKRPVEMRLGMPEREKADNAINSQDKVFSKNGKSSLASLKPVLAVNSGIQNLASNAVAKPTSYSGTSKISLNQSTSKRVLENELFNSDDDSTLSSDEDGEELIEKRAFNNPKKKSVSLPIPCHAELEKDMSNIASEETTASESKPRMITVKQKVVRSKSYMEGKFLVVKDEEAMEVLQKEENESANTFVPHSISAPTRKNQTVITSFFKKKC